MMQCKCPTKLLDHLLETLDTTKLQKPFYSIEVYLSLQYGNLKINATNKKVASGSAVALRDQSS